MRDNAGAPGPVPGGYRCLLCGGAAGRLLFRKGELELARCAACGFVQLHPAPDEAACAAEYETDGHYGDELRRTEEQFLERDRALLAELAARGGAGPLLDVGAGAGIILRAARERGWEAVGLELSAPNAARMRTELGVAVHETSIERAPLAAGSFGTVVFSHSLEHVADPASALRRAHELLRPGGLLHLAVPNWRAAKRTLAGPNLPWIYAHHVSYFDRASLGRALAAAGLAPLEWRTAPWPGRDYPFALGTLRHVGLEPALQRWLRLGRRPLDELVTDDVRLDCPPWRFRALLNATHAFLGAWPDRLLSACGRGDELRVTARREA